MRRLKNWLQGPGLVWAVFLFGIATIVGAFVFLSHVEKIDEDGYHWR